MLFNSLDFALFLAVVLPLYYALSWQWQNRMLVAASYFFYACWNWHFVSLLAISTVVDFWCAQLIHRSSNPATRRRWLLVTLCLNLGFLGVFKYYGFFVDSFVELMKLAGIAVSVPVLQVLLPVGISFYTLQSISYSIDVYYRRTEPTTDFVAFALYVSYFPHLVAGPIQRSTQLLPQLQRPRTVDRLRVATATQLILMGYFKKVFIADGVAPFVDHAFTDPQALGAVELWMSLYLFAIQIYGDFSGYTDIARGVSRLLGIELTLNFRQPYLASDITDFWRRWHIALSTFLRDYVYIPLGGNRHGTLHTYRNLMFTMLLGGLWHGASWTFVVWGGLHGIYLAVHRIWTRGRPVSSAPPESVRGRLVHGLKVLATFHLVSVTLVIFRAGDLDVAWRYLSGLVVDWQPCPPGLAIAVLVYGLLMLLVDLSCAWRDRETPVDESWPAWSRGLAFATMIILISFIGEPNARPFIYFQF